MTVKELIEELSKYPQDMRVYHSTEDVAGVPVEEVKVGEVKNIGGFHVKILELE